MVRFANDNLRKMFAGYGDEAIESRMLTTAITGAQKRIEGQNFDVRKNLLDYDDVLSKQRQIMYSKRDQILFATNINELLYETFKDCGVALCKRSVPENSQNKGVNGENLVNLIVPRFFFFFLIKPALYDEANPTEAGEDLGEILLEAYMSRKKEWDPELADRIERQITLKCIDRNWTQQIDNMTRFRESVSLRSYGQINPLQDYVNEGWAMFREMLETISLEVVLNLMNVKVERKIEEKPKEAFTINANSEPKQETPELNENKVEDENLKVVEKGSTDLNITHIDKDAKAAADHEYDDIHTN